MIPTKALLQLNNLSQEDIRVKLKNLEFAQRVIFSDHPKNLFVPVFLKESVISTEAHIIQ